MKFSIIIFIGYCLIGCTTTQHIATQKKENKTPFVWDAANVYFLLTDRFQNGTTDNDINFERTEKAAILRGFEGGDLRGIIQKLDENYFSDLGINSIWMTPLVEQIHGSTDEGTGKTYAYHGYWTKDWTALDPNFGTKNDLKELIEKAHKKGIRIILDVVINHTGPVTETDKIYPADWVRNAPQCKYDNYLNTTACTLVANLPDVLTDSNINAGLPKMLEAKWKKEGRYDNEMASLNAFFKKYNLPKAPKYYIMKWLSDYITQFGIDGFRIDTVKHVNEDVWKDFQKICQDAFTEYKKNNPSKVLDDAPFFTVGEVYGYGISQKQNYDFGDKKVNYFQNGFNALINFDFKGDANKSYEEQFSNYSNLLQNDMKGFTVMNYITSHDDAQPYDLDRKKNIEAATKLLLSPGISQIYYGDESARPLNIKGAVGDANLRSNMNWDEIKHNPVTQKRLLHWQKLGKFRADHPAVGAGVHLQISSKPYYFSRIYKTDQFEDKVIIGLDLGKGLKEIPINGIFKIGAKIRDAYSEKNTVVNSNGKVEISSDFNIVLLEEIK